MRIHFHSLYAGVLVLVMALSLKLPILVGAAVIPLCLLIDSGQIIDRMKTDRNPWLYAAASFLQALVLYAIYVATWFALHREGS